jgi:lipopolysaccharide/colanic/teichoic acid biosynthesis glycosyltransferase
LQLTRVVACLALGALVPLLAAIALATLLCDGRPVLFRQARLGLRRKPFDIVKFRTMRDGVPNRVGRLLRATGLDELPQLWNCARGQMAFVGPRPLRESDVARLGWDSPAADARWSVLPGITGLAQLSRVCAAKISLHHDLLYASRKSARLDAWVLLRSALVPLLGKVGRRRRG